MMQHLVNNGVFVPESLVGHMVVFFFFFLTAQLTDGGVDAGPPSVDVRRYVHIKKDPEKGPNSDHRAIK